MINLIIGQPGGGKTYEAVAFHLMPALAKGRKVITNLPLNLEQLALIDPSFPALIDLRHDSIKKPAPKKAHSFYRFSGLDNEPITCRPFSSMEFYSDEWRHPVHGFGALYIIDECHLCLPRQKTDKAVEEWYSLHRHEVSDVLLITQSYGKVCKDITDMVQVCYRVKKATAFGSNDRYIRKVQDGVRGEVVNTSIRVYESKYFPLYKSHTKSSEAGQELAANDIKPIWMRWPFIGAGLCFSILMIMFFFGASLNPFKASKDIVAKSSQPANDRSKIDSQVSAVPLVHPSGVKAVLEPYTPPKPVSQVTDKSMRHPFDGLTLHIIGFIESSTKFLYQFSVDQNGQPAFTVSQRELEASGYSVEKMSACSARIRYGTDVYFYALCDVARVGFGLASR